MNLKFMSLERENKTTGTRRARFLSFDSIEKFQGQRSPINEQKWPKMAILAIFGYKNIHF